MAEMIHDYITKTTTVPWMPLVEAGGTRGISVKALRIDPQTGRAPSFLLKFEPGASYPYNNRPAGEELYVREGSCEIEGRDAPRGHAGESRIGRRRFPCPLHASATH